MRTSRKRDVIYDLTENQNEFVSREERADKKKNDHHLIIATLNFIPWCISLLLFFFSALFVSMYATNTRSIHYSPTYDGNAACSEIAY